MRITIGLLLLIAFGANAEAATFRVGSGTSCTHWRLGDALAAAQANGAASDLITITKAYSESASGPYFIGSHSVQIRGGYDSCAATAPSGTSTLRSRGGGSLFRVTGTTTVSFSNLVLDGNGTTVAAGGALSIGGSAAVDVRATRMHGFRATDGGAISIVDDRTSATAPAPSLTLYDALIESNAATRKGGGVRCYGRANVTVYGDAVIWRNSAADGGGVALSGCLWRQYAGTVSENSASAGGGFQLSDAALATLARGTLAGQPAAPVIARNRASFWGGGVFATGSGTMFDAYGLQLVGNGVETEFGTGEGAALLAGWGATASLQRDAGCPKGTQCSRIADNFAEMTRASASPSVVEARAGGLLRVAGTEIQGNRLRAGGTTAGVVVRSFSSEPASTVLLKNSLLRANAARALLGASEWTYEARTFRGALRAQLITAHRNFVGALAASEFTGALAPVALEASVVDDDVPFFLGELSASGTIDCVLSRRAPPWFATRSVGASASSLEYTTSRPRPFTTPIDYCSIGALPVGERDVNGDTRVVNDVDVFDRYGRVDIGAFERQPAIIGFDPG